MYTYRNQEAFREAWGFFKGNLHCHTTVSDGAKSHAELLAGYRAQGYHFLCFSDHDVYTDCTAMDAPDFITLPGVEWACSDVREGVCVQTHHMHGIAGTAAMLAEAAAPPLTHMQRLERLAFRGAETVGEMGAAMTARGCLAMYNHPLWSCTAPSDLGGLPGYTLLEIYNNGCALENRTGHAADWWDTLLRAGHRVWGTATDDNHNHSQAARDDSYGGWICVNAPCLTRDTLIEAMLAGRFYASSGPIIHRCGMQAGRAYVVCSPVARVNFVATGVVAGGGTVWPQQGGTLTEAAYTLSGKESYLRIECVDAQGRTAWSNPFFPE